MPIYVIHIGPPKVGSKYLQTSLAGLSAKMQPDGIYYPTTLFSSTPQVWHLPLADRLKQGRSSDLEGVFSALNAADYRYIVFSFEGLFGLNAEQLSYFSELLAGSAVQIIYYCRRWSERIPSLWKQNVKEGLVETFPETYARAVQEPVVAPDLNPTLIWEKFEKIFGRESIKLVSFNNLIDHKIDLVEHFMKLFLGGYSAPRGEVFMNESPDVFDTEILRALNAIHVRRTGKTSDTVRIRYLKRRKQLDVDLLTRAMHNDLGQINLSDRFQVFETVYQQMNAYLDRLVSTEYGNYFFKRQSVKYDFVQQNYLLDETVVRELYRVYDFIIESS